MKSGRLILIAVILLLGLAPGPAETHFGSAPTIGHYTVVESKTIPGYVIMTFRAQLTNPLPYAITDVSAALTCHTVGAAVIDGTLTFPDAEAGATVTSLTTFTLRLPKSRPFDASHLEWAIHFKKRNRIPIADAGPDQTVAVGAHVMLDGSGSRDPDGDAIKFFWHFVSKPAGSYAMLSSTYAVRPTFVADRSGIYVLELVVSDREAKSAPDRVQITAGGAVNTRPVANAGLDQTVAVGTVVQLDGSASTDADGDALTFKWRLVSTPPQSAAALSDPTALRPTVRIDRAGTYVAELVVNDGRLDSAVDTVQISTVNSRPIAVAGADQTVSHGATVALDGRASTDVDGDPLTFRWDFTARPDGSQATLNDPASPTPTFIADLPGRYEVRLIVNDGFVDSTPDSAQIDTVNSRPVADAGPDQTVAVGDTVHLDGSASGDADGDPLTFRWSFTTRPDGSVAALDDPATAQPSFVADRAGDYVAQLIVNDGFEDGLADTVVVTATTGNRPPVADAGPDQTVAVGTTVRPDGSRSSDPDGTPIASYAWTLTRPDGSNATLSSATLVNPTFVADRAGTYTAELIVSDGALSSAPDSVTVTVTDAADLRIAFVNPPVTPAVASSVSLVVEVANAGPSAASGVAARFQVPAGYTVTSSAPDANAGTYDVATGVWTIGAVPTSAAVRLTVAATVKPTGPYDLTATITASTPTDPNPANNTATASVVPNANADLGIAFASVPTTPAIGASVSIAVEIVNGGPAGTTGVTARFKPPAGYTVTASSTTASSASGGTYDTATGNWTIGAMPAAGTARLTVTATVNATGPYDVAATITGSAQPDPNSANNTATASVALGGNPADLSIAFFSVPNAPPVGGIASPTGISVQVRNEGPATATGVTARFKLPAGYTIRSGGPGVGTYDGVTGDWTIGTLVSGGFANLGFDALVNATGPYDLTATITGSSQPDPNPANNTVTVTVTPNRNADLSVAFISAPNSPPVGGIASPTGISVQVRNEGPATATGVTARFKLPAGYTIRSGGPGVGTYDGVTGDWTIGTLVSGGFANLGFDALVNATGPYDLTATITGSSGIDPNPANNTVTVAVTPNRNADLSVAFISAPNSPPVGGIASPTGIFVQVLNNGPATTTVVTARFKLPAGYTIRSGGPSVGTYDGVTGDWTIGTLVSGSFANLSFDAFVNATGPYDLTATITGSSGIDPNPANNTVTVAVTPNRNANLKLFFFDFPQGTLAPGASANLALEVDNLGPASTTGITASVPVPAGYTITSVNAQVGTYDPATGAWVVGGLSSGSLARLGLGLRVNAAGPTAVTASITGSTAPDPDLTNNAAVAPAINRPPVANVGADQSVSTNTTVQLDGRASSDAEGDALTFQWTFALRPVNSTAVLVGATTTTPSFVPDLGGTYRVQLVVTDTRGAASAPATTTILASLDNHPPVIRSIAVTAATVGLAYRYSVDAIDPDAGDVPTFSLPTAPAGMTIGADTGIIRWTPVDTQAGPQPVVVRVQDQRGLFATQAFEVQVSSAANRAPVAADDAYTARLGESLGVGAPGVLANDTDVNGTPLTAVLLTPPTNGTLAFNPDGSFTYTPHTLQAGELVLADDIDLIRAIPGTTFNMKGDPGVVGPPCDRTACAFDDNLGTMASTFGINPATFEVVFPQDTTVTQVRVLSGRNPVANRITTGTFQLLAAGGAVLHDSGPVEFPLPERDAILVVPGVASVRRVRFTPLTGERGPFEINLAEMKVIGSALIRRQRIAEPNLAQLLPATVQAGSFIGVNVPESVIDDSAGTSWYAANGAGDFIEISFPVDVTVTGIETLNPGATPDGFGSSSPILCHGTFQLLDAGRTVLFDSGIVNTPFNDRGIGASLFTLPVPTTPGVRSARYTVGSCAGSAFPAGFSEIRILGTTPVTTPAFQLTKKFQALAGREVHSTPVVANLTDDNGDGVIDTRDVPDIVVAVESLGNQLTGEIKVLSGDDGRELFTLGPGLVSPWSEVAVGDIDGDGVPDIIAVHSDGNHLIAFDLAGGTVQGDLTQVLRPVTVNVSSSSSQFLPADGVDGRLETPWLTANGDAANLGGHPFFEVEFRQDVTVTQVQLIGNRGFIGLKFLAGFFQLFAADGSLLFDSGVVQLPPPDRDFTLTVPSVAGVRRVRFTGTDDAGASVGLTEFKVFGSATVATGSPKVKWISDPNPMPRFLIGSSALFGGAVSIANLDGGPRPHIIVGASVFDADGRLLGDGRTLGGTTGGTGLRSAISAIVDLDLDGIPEIVAGPTAYRLVNGHLEIVWQRKDLPDGYVAIGNFDDDPFPEIVIVADGQIYMLNHDGSDAEVWNPPSHGPVVTPGAPEGAAGPANGQSGAPLIVDVDGDGIPEIGIAKAANYLLYNRDGSLRWKAAISDRSSHSTGSVAFDFDGDGTVEIVYRDEKFLRIFRGADGVLLAKVPVQSSTWAEQPVVVDVDNDGHADIVVTSDLSSGLAGDTGVFVFRDVANKWTRTRRIWNQHSYHITNVNENGSIPRVEPPHWLVPGLNSFRTNAFVPGESADAFDSFTYAATDGVLDSNVATVRIAVNTPNSAPRFTSSPVTTAGTAVRYVYAARATDPDAGDVLTFSLPTAPTGMTIEPATGLVQWTPTAGQLGSQAVVIKVHDAHGLFALQSYSVQVAAPVTVPNVVGQPQATAQSSITNATLSVGSVGTHTSATVASGAVISQNPGAGTSVARGTSVSLVVSLGPPPIGTVPDVVGQSQSSAQADITAAGFVLGPVVSVHTAVVPLGVVISQSPSAGTTATAGSAVNLVVSLGLPPADVDLDRDGFTGNQGDCDDTNGAINPNAIDIAGDGIDQNCNGRDSIVGDTTPPTVSIDAPAEDAVLTMPTEIIGTATDANFLRYTLELRLASDVGPSVVIGSGSVAVIGAVLGRLDPTRLENGIYRVRLTAEDVNGQIAVAERAYRVDGLAKVGNFRLSFTDLSIPVAGIPIAIERTYDSRVKTREDFGIGWTLDIKRGFYQHNRTPGEGWQILSSGFPALPCRTISETVTHLTQVRLSDRESYTFALTLSNPFALTGGCQATAGFRFVDGYRPGATLEILDGTDVFYLNGDSQVVSQDTFLVYDPRMVRLTTVDGRVIDFERGAGITRIQDANANALTITPGGIVHSSGKSIAFERDAQGRITRVTDPNGNPLAYGYDGSGDLVTFTDSLGNRTTYTYDARHDLIEIRDPLGRRPLRTEYDDDGRVVAVIDATGLRTTITHDLAARQEIVTDRLGRASVVEYDVRGNIVRRTDPLGHVATATYDARDNTLSETDPLGNTHRYTYDAADNLLTATDPLGHTTAYTYNARNQELTRTDPLGATTTSTYDPNGNVLTQTDPLGNVTRYTHDTRGNTLTATDALGAIRMFAYDDAGNQITARDALGHVVTYAYDSNGNRLSERQAHTAASGAQEIVLKTHQYDGLNRLVQTVRPAGLSTRITYDAAGQSIGVVDQAGRTTGHTYDEQGRLTLTTYPDGTRTGSSYDAEGRRIANTDQAGRTTGYQLDALGRVTRITHSDGAVEDGAYDAAGRLVTVTDERGHTTTIAYDAAGRRTTTTDPLGQVATLTYDASGRIVAVRTPRGGVTSYEYDANGRHTRVVYPDGSDERIGYDAAGRMVQKIDPLGHATRFEYDARGRLVTITDALGQTIHEVYDELGHQVAHTDADGRTTRYEHDALGRRTKRTLPLGQMETFVYGLAGRPASRTDFRGYTTTYTYDALNRLISKTPDGQLGEPAVTFAYSTTGRRTSMTDATGTTAYGYDARDRLVQKATPRGTLTYAYDAAGNVLSIRSSHPDGAAVDYTYDVLDRLVGVTDARLPSGQGTTAYAYDANGNLSNRAYPNGISSIHAYDSLDRPIRISIASAVATLADYTHVVDRAGRRVSVTEATGRMVAYAYDALDRLTGEAISGDPSGRNGTIGYTYDAVGNRLSRSSSVPAVTSTSSLYDANDRLTSDSYDANGNTLATEGHAYVYGFEDRLTSADGGAATFTYDGDGHRVARTANGTTTEYLIDDRNPTGRAQVLEEIVGGQVQRVYTYGRSLISRRSADGSVRFYHQDGQGSVRLLTDAAASPTDAYDYEAFGGLVRSTGDTPNDYLFRAEQLDPTLGAYYLRARYYQADRGRFLTADSWAGDTARPQTLHKYVYPSNNPVMLADPSGHFGLAEVGVTVGISSVLAASPNATPNPRGVKGGSGPIKNLVVDVVTHEFGADPFYQHAERADQIYGLNGVNIKISEGEYAVIPEERLSSILNRDMELPDGCTKAQVPEVPREIQRLVDSALRTPGRITLYYVPALASGADGLTFHNTTCSLPNFPTFFPPADPPFITMGTKIWYADTLAHELGHALADLKDFRNSDHISYLMYGYGLDRTGYDISKKDSDALRRSRYLSP